MGSASVLALFARVSEQDNQRDSSHGGRPPAYKAVGISLAVASGFLIGVSFVLKKAGLLKANLKYNEEAGEGYGYLKSAWWWAGMTLMVLGEVCNFIAYAFVDAILVTPLGALSVVVTTVLSAIFLKERLSFVGKVGCFSCIVGAVVIAMNAPQQSSVSDIQEMQHFVISPGFLVYAGVIIVGCAAAAVWAGPRYGKRSMFVYLGICSLIGGLSVVAIQGLGAAVLAQINGKAQFHHWFLYVLFAFVVATLVTEIIYLNKALNIFNAALVTPTYYVLFTSATIATSAILFRGLNSSGVEIATIVMGFLQICAGVVLLQLSKSAKDIPDAAIFKGDLDQVREVATQEEPESEPRADSIRGAASIVRRISTLRRNMAEEEARRFFKEKHEDSLSAPLENEVIEWDGIRRRKTFVGDRPAASRLQSPGVPGQAKNAFPPLGMTHFPENDHDVDEPRRVKQDGYGFFEGIRSRASFALHSPYRHQDRELDLSDSQLTPIHSVALANAHDLGTSYQGPGAGYIRHGPSISWADEVSDEPENEEEVTTFEHLPHAAQRQFSFSKIFRGVQPRGESSNRLAHSPRGILRRAIPTADYVRGRPSTEEERLGLVHGDIYSLGKEDMKETLERTQSPSSDDGSLSLATEARPRRYPSMPAMSTVSSSGYDHEGHGGSNSGHRQSIKATTPRNVTAHVPRDGPVAALTSQPNPLPSRQGGDLALAEHAEGTTT